MQKLELIQVQILTNKINTHLENILNYLYATGIK